MSLTDQEIESLNNWARTEPPLRGTFPYTEGRPGLGDRLNDLGDSHHGVITAEAFYLINGGELLPNNQLDHGLLLGLLDDDHPQYLLVDGTRPMTGDLQMGNKDILNAAAGVFNDKVTAEAFYGRFATIRTIDAETVQGRPGQSLSILSDDSISISADGDIIVDTFSGSFLGGVRTFDIATGNTVISADSAVGPGATGRVDISASDDTHIHSTLRVDDVVSAEAFYLNSGGELLPNNQLDHGALLGLSDDDHLQYLPLTGVRAMTGDLDMGGKDVLNAAAGNFRDRVRAEAFYLESGGELSAVATVNTQLKHGAAAITMAPVGTFTMSGSAISAVGSSSVSFAALAGNVSFTAAAGDVSLSPAASGKINLNGYVQATDQIRTTERIVAEAFYFADGGEVIRSISDGPTTLQSRRTLVFNQADFYLTQDSTGSPVVNLVGPTVQVISPAYNTFSTTSTSVVPVTGAKFSVVAGAHYHFRACWLAHTTDTSEGVGFGFSFPAGVNSVRVSQPTGTGAGGGAGHIIDGTFAASSFQTPGANAIGTTANTPALFTAEGLLRPSVDGDVNLQYRVETGAFAWTVESGMVFFVTRIS